MTLHYRRSGDNPPPDFVGLSHFWFISHHCELTRSINGLWVLAGQDRTCEGEAYVTKRPFPKQRKASGRR
jgi:hypothetical protein